MRTSHLSGSGGGNQGDMGSEVLLAIVTVHVWGELSAWAESLCGGFDMG